HTSTLFPSPPLFRSHRIRPRSSAFPPLPFATRLSSAGEGCGARGPLDKLLPIYQTDRRSSAQLCPSSGGNSNRRCIREKPPEERSEEHTSELQSLRH